MNWPFIVSVGSICKRLALVPPSVEIYERALQIGIEFTYESRFNLLDAALNRNGQLNRVRDGRRFLRQRIGKLMEKIASESSSDAKLKAVSSYRQLRSVSKRVDSYLENLPASPEDIVYDNILRLLTAHCVINIETGCREFNGYQDFEKRIDRREMVAVISFATVAEQFPEFYANLPPGYHPSLFFELGFENRLLDDEGQFSDLFGYFDEFDDDLDEQES